MEKDSQNFDNIALAFHPHNQAAHALAEKIGSFLEAQGKTTLLGTMDDQELREGVSGGSQDLLIALGGDGTMLRAGHASAPSRVPILGINLGSFGFLTEIQRDDWQAALLRVLQGDDWLD